MTQYPTPEQIHAIHEEIVGSNEETEAGVLSPGDVEFAVTYIRSSYEDTTLHEEAAQLLRLIAVNHPYVDGNKRTALTAAARLYNLNGYTIEPDDEIRSILKRLGTDEQEVPTDEIVQYLKEHTHQNTH